MIEATPAMPYGKNANDLLELEGSLRNRRARIQRHLGDSGGLCSLPAWPRMGQKDFVEGSEKILGERANSIFLPDHVINPHVRFGTLVENIRLRKGRNVEIHVPLFKDKNTNVEELKQKNLNLLKNSSTTYESCDEIYMDGMGFGMGCCCLQVTFQARDVEQSRSLYDQLAVLCPIFLSLSAGTPILKGLLAGTDVRWSVIAQSVDCRTPKELGKINPKRQRGEMKINKSRYDSIDMYISNSSILKEKFDFYNDLNSEIDEKTYKLLIKNGIDEVLAKHISHLFIRDPMVIFKDRIEVNNKKSTEHFENIQSTNWQTMRWKPPPANNNNIGWRVEFRPMESQLTDFENAAYIISIVLLSRVILFFNLNLYIPLSKVDENMKTAHKIDSVLEQKFWFRTQIIPLETECNEDEEENINNKTKQNDFDKFTIAEILHGKGDTFPGLFPLIYAYLDIIECDETTYAVVTKYLTFLRDRSEGKIKTLARWMRDFVAKHEDYKQDSVISKKIETDLVETCYNISNGVIQDESLLGLNFVQPSNITEREVKEDGQSRRLRGSSFSEHFQSLKNTIKQEECDVIRDLIKKYRGRTEAHVINEKSGFKDTPAFLPKLG